MQLPNGSSATIQVDHTWTISHLKQELWATQGLSALRLVYAGRDLRENRELTIQPGDTVRCLFNLNGGGKAKSKGGKSFKKGKKIEAKTELIFKEEEQEYAQVVKLLGSSRMLVVCADGKERMCRIRGKLVRRAWVSVGTVVLISLREWEDDKCDMIHKYTDEEARRLHAYKELPQTIKLVSDEGDNAAIDDGIVFEFVDETNEINIDDI